jgi:hypothetical protein
MNGRKESKVLELRRRWTTSIVGYGQYENAMARKIKEMRNMMLMVR